ncbi:MAG: hypothetical protein ACNA7W_03230 [Pseudomonadales bacterium]
MSAVARLIVSRPVYRLLYKRLRLPRPWVHGLLSRARGRILGPELEQRRALFEQLDAAADPLPFDPASAIALLTPDSLPDAEATAARCRAIFADFQRRGVAAEVLQRNPKKRFLLSLVSGNEFFEHSQLLRFMVSHKVLDTAARYLGTLPRLEGAALWWTPPNDTATSSQKAHIDELAPRQVKILLHCDAVDLDRGPLHVLPADRTDEVLDRHGRGHGRLDDEQLAQSGVLDQMYPVLGPAASGIMFDSSRCLHYGSRRNLHERLVLAFHFMAADTPVYSRYHLGAARLPAELDDLDVYQRMALGA